MSDKNHSLYVQLCLQLRSKVEILESKLPAGGGSEPIRHFQQMLPTMDWWWPSPPKGYIDPNAYTFLSRMPAYISGPPGKVPIYEGSAKNLYSTYRSVLLTAPKVDVGGSKDGDSWNTQYQTALTESEKPSSPSEDKPGFVKMTTNAGTTVCDGFVVADGKDWQSELKKKAEESPLEGEDMYSPGEHSGLRGILQNVSFHITTEFVPSEKMSIPNFTDSNSIFAVFTANGAWEKLDIAPSDKIAASVRAGAVGTVPLHPDPHWYNTNFLEITAKRNSWNPPFTREDIFGENGLLSGMLYSFNAAYKVSYNLAMSPETYKKFEPLFKAALGFRIGPFHFGVGNDQLPLAPGWKFKVNPDTYTFEGHQSIADFPTVIGVSVVRILPDQDFNKE